MINQFLEPGTSSKSKLIPMLELTTVVGTVAGSLVSAATQQVVYLSVPLSLAIGLHVVNHRGLKWQQQQTSEALDFQQQQLSQQQAEMATMGQTLKKRQGKLHQTCQLLNEVADYSRKIQAAGQDSSDLYYQRGLCYQQLGNLDSARVDFDTAIVTDPSLAEAYFERGQIKVSQGYRQAALADFRASANHYFSRGDLARYQEAKEKMQSLHDTRHEEQEPESAGPVSVEVFFG